MSRSCPVRSRLCCSDTATETTKLMIGSHTHNAITHLDLCRARAQRRRRRATDFAAVERARRRRASASRRCALRGERASEASPRPGRPRALTVGWHSSLSNHRRSKIHASPQCPRDGGRRANPPRRNPRSCSWTAPAARSCRSRPRTSRIIASSPRRCARRAATRTKRART